MKGETIESRLASLERRVTLLEAARKRAQGNDRCRFVDMPEGKRWLPRCPGGLAKGKKGCTCA